MNGRLYDGAVGRFLSPDIHIQDPDNSQSFNRYGYCLNNPLKYIDPSGYTWLSQLGKWMAKNAKTVTIAATIVVAGVATIATAGMASPLLAAAIVGASGGFASGAVGTWLSGGSFWQGMGAGAINGAAAGWASKHLGSFAINSLEVAGKSAIGGFFSGVIGGTTGGYVGGFATGLLMTGNLEQAHKMGKQGALFGGIAGGALGGYRGFRDAKALGNNPWTGAAKSVTEGTNVVYQGFDKAGVVRYVGITERAPAIRFAEHLNSGTGKSLLQYRVVDGATGLSRTGARVWEQTLINQYGLQKNGGLLFNKINSIAPKNWSTFGIY